MNVSQLRKTNLKLLIEGPPYLGAIATFARAIDRDDAYVWQLVRAKGKSARPIGEKIARYIESKLKLPHLALDSPISTRSTEAQQPLALYSLDTTRQSKILALFDGLTVAQQDDFISQLEAAVESNTAIAREVGKRLSHPTDLKVANHLPRVPTKQTSK